MKRSRIAVLLILLLTVVLAGCAGHKTQPPAVETPCPPVTAVPAEKVPDIPESYAESILHTMTIQEKIGQMFLYCYRTEMGDPTPVITDCHIGGMVLFADSFKYQTPDSVRTQNTAYQSASKLPLILAVDEEGGIVTRISRYPQFRASAFLSPRELIAQGGMTAVKNDTVEKCKLLRSLCMNVNLAPVADISVCEDDFIYSRSAGDTETACAFVSTVVQTMQDSGVGAVLKHFPGYGNNADTHTGSAYDSRPYETFVQNDFLPFSAGMKAGNCAIMVSHNVVGSMDANNPASLSPAVHTLLREKLQFNGVIITDDLGMQAIRDNMSDGEAAVRVVEAGNDLICCTNVPERYQAILQAVNSGRISESRIDESVLRILQYKIDCGIL